MFCLFFVFIQAICLVRSMLNCITCFSCKNYRFCVLFSISIWSYFAGIQCLTYSSIKKRLQRCIHHFKSDWINNMDYMHISSTEQIMLLTVGLLWLLFHIFSETLLWVYECHVKEIILCLSCLFKSHVSMPGIATMEGEGVQVLSRFAKLTLQKLKIV